MRTFKILLFLIVLALIGLVAFSYFGDMKPETRDTILEVPLPGVAAGNDN